MYSGDIADLPDEHESRRERFAEIDDLQSGWQVELHSRGDLVTASFLSPTGSTSSAFGSPNLLKTLMRHGHGQVPALAYSNPWEHKAGRQFMMVASVSLLEICELDSGRMLRAVVIAKQVNASLRMHWREEQR